MARATTDLRAGEAAVPSGGAARTARSALVWLLCLPFLGFGLFAANEGANRLATDGEQGALLLLFGVGFSGLPVLVLLASRVGKRQKARIDHRRLLHPDEPWRWSGRWADGRIRCDNRAGMVVAWIFAAVWNGLSWPLLPALPRELERGNEAALLGLLFPLAGLGLLVWAVRATLRWRRFGVSVFELSACPGVLGGALAGTLQAGVGLAGARELRARLSCIRRRVYGSGRTRSVDEDVVWADEERLPGSLLARGPQGLALPVRFALPYDGRPTDPLPSDDRILWRLEVTAAVPGVDYHARFEVPVFHTPASDPALTSAALAGARARG